MEKRIIVGIAILYGAIVVGTIALAVQSSIVPTVPSSHAEIFHSQFKNKS